MLNWLFKRRAPEVETRASGSGYTTELMRLRADWLSGTEGIAEATATAQSCVSLWEGGIGLADVSGTDLLDRRSMALLGRALALRGEAVFLIEETGLVPASDWDLSTRNGKPVAYRLSIPEIGGGRTQTALAPEVLHIRIGSDPAAPWAGTAPLRRAQITAQMLEAVERALAETFQNAPIGSSVLPFPEVPDQDLNALSRSFRARRGRVLLRESLAITAAGGPVPAQDWRPSDLTPDLSRAMTSETLRDAREAICMAFGVLPGMLSPNTTGPLVRESQRQLASWTLQPIAELIAQEATAKLGSEVRLDVMRPLQAFDAGGRARAMAQIVQTLALAKEAGVDPAEALRIVNWNQEDQK